MKRKVMCWMLFAVCASALVGACGKSKDEEVQATLRDLDNFTKELVRRVESAQNPSNGVDEAQKFLDANREQIAVRLKALREMRGGEVRNDEELKGKLLESVTNNVMSVAGLQIKYMSQSMQDPAFKARLDRLVSDYQSLFRV